MAIRIPKAPGVSGKNAEGRSIRNGKATSVAKKHPTGKRKVAQSKTRVKKA